MIDKYNIDFSKETINSNIRRLTNQIWKLVPMLENKEDWKKQLQTVIIEVAGLGEIFSQNPLFLQLLAKLEGLLIETVSFEVYRKTVFESISLIQTIEGE